MYSTSPNQPITSPFQPMFLFDRTRWENFDETDAHKHFTNISNLLIDRVAILRKDNTTLSLQDEKELQLLLDAFIQAKTFFQTKPTE